MDSANPSSRFLKEINDDYIDKENVVFETKNKDITISTTIDKDVSYNIGDKVIHDIFGEGIIVSMDKSIVTIAFPHPHGIKKIMKGHTSIKKVK